MSGLRQKVAKLIADPGDGAFQPAPDLDQCRCSRPHSAGRSAFRDIDPQTASSRVPASTWSVLGFGRVSLMRRKVANAWPTT